MKNYYLKSIAVLLGCTLVGTIAAAIAGYLGGALGGLAMTFYNNNLMTGASPQGSYVWWANFCGWLIACFAFLPGGGIGFLFGLVKILEKPQLAVKNK
jgi:hypothetical protein